jgi:hypothetical protein
MRNFTICGYIINVDGNRLTIRVDNEYIETVAFVATLHKKVSTAGNFITVNIRSAKFDIKNLDWKELIDLKGVHIKLECTTRVSQFVKRISVPDSLKTDEYISNTSVVNMVSFVAKTVKNIDN